MACPLSVVGADPAGRDGNRHPATVPNFLPSVRMPETPLIEYDFVPETTHPPLLQEPDLCAEFTLTCLAGEGFATP